MFVSADDRNVIVDSASPQETPSLVTPDEFFIVGEEDIDSSNEGFVTFQQSYGNPWE